MVVSMATSWRCARAVRFGRGHDFAVPTLAVHTASAARLSPPNGRLGCSDLRPIPGARRRPYDRDVRNLVPVAARLPRGLAERFAAMPQRRQERVQDVGLAGAVAAVNAVALLPYLHRLHPAGLAMLLVIAQAVPLAWRRSYAVGAGLVVGVARVGYDRLGFGFAPFPLAPAIAFYTVIDRRGPVWRRIGVLVVVVALVVSETAPGHSEPYDAIFQVTIFLTAWAAGTLSRAKRASLQAAQVRADRAEAELDHQAARAAAAERTRIARELHDVVAHHVSLMAVQAEAAGSLLPGRPEQARKSVQVIGDTARQALTELRRLLGVLRTPSEQLDKAPSASLADLSAVLDQVRDAGLGVELDVIGEPYPLAASIDLTAYRIVQEALTNTLKHTTASTACVTLRYEPGFITVAVTDRALSRAEIAADGAPRPGALAAATGTGFGLAGIAERVASCGGNLTVGPAPDSGFAVAARLPAR
jgi:signal transduction histidine kinase